MRASVSSLHVISIISMRLCVALPHFRLTVRAESVKESLAGDEKVVICSD